jgi:hypothetical protein
MQFSVSCPRQVYPTIRPNAKLKQALKLSLIIDPRRNSFPLMASACQSVQPPPLLPHPSFNFALPYINLPNCLDKAVVDAFIKTLAEPLLGERLQGKQI